MNSWPITGSLSKFLRYQFRRAWAWYVAAIGALFVTHYIQALLPFYVKDLADWITGKGPEFDLWIFPLVAVGIVLFRTANRLLFFTPARDMERKLRLAILGKLEVSPPGRYLSHSKGQIFQVLYNDVEQMRALVGFALLQVGNVLVALLVIVPKVMSFHSKLPLAFIPMVIAFVLFSIIVGNSRKFYRKMQDAGGEVQHTIIETYRGKKTIKNFHAEKAFLKIFDQKSYEELLNHYRAGIRVSLSIPLNHLGVGISFLWGAWMIQQAGLGASALILFSGFVFLFIEPLMYVSWIGVVFTSSLASWSRIQELAKDLDKKSLQEEQIDRYNPNNEGPVHVPFWESDLTLSPEAGKWTVFVGPTGCGKSWVLSSLALAYQKRQVKVSSIGQGPYLYNDTVEKNIFLGREPSEAERKQAYKYLKLFELGELALGQEALLSLTVGEHGKHLSGGQAKRLTLVRSLMSGAEIFLWDDPFSSIDVIQERKILERLRQDERLQGKTILLSSHRATTVKLCDEYYFLSKDAGITEYGNTSQLRGRESKVYEFFEQQLEQIDL